MKKGQSMPRNQSAIAALKKLEADRNALDRKQLELEEQAALEIGRIILGTGLENFSVKGLTTVARSLARRGEPGALTLLNAAPVEHPRSSKPAG